MLKKFFALALCLMLIATAFCAMADQVNVGDTIFFGNYPQTASGDDNTPIEWQVLDVQDSKALVISRYGLETKNYNKMMNEVTWETCTLRTWLNSSFFYEAFSSTEQEAILMTDVDNSESQCFDFTTVLQYGEKTSGGSNTQDKVFLLSCAEANQYFDVSWGDGSNIKSRIAPTAYAAEHGAFIPGGCTTEDGQASCSWLLRSPGGTQYDAASVQVDGSLDNFAVQYGYACVRPALWLDLNSAQQ